jgi:hypothetical protein
LIIVWAIDGTTVVGGWVPHCLAADTLTYCLMVMQAMGMGSFGFKLFVFL